jgi:hypothetical protein
VAELNPGSAIHLECTLLSDDDLYLFNEGTHLHLYEKLGSHPLNHQGAEGTYFAVWAPDAESMAVIGDFNRWDKSRSLLRPRGQSGIWEGFIPGLGKGAIYKYHVSSRYRAYRADKADPYGVHHETPPKTASIVWDLFSNYVAASEALGVDADYRAKIAAMRDRLVGPQVGKWGQLQEWMVDRDDPNDHHRHTSHLFAVFPGRQISVAGAPEFAAAAKKSLGSFLRNLLASNATAVPMMRKTARAR